MNHFQGMVLDLRTQMVHTSEYSLISNYPDDANN